MSCAPLLGELNRCCGPKRTTDSHGKPPVLESRFRARKAAEKVTGSARYVDDLTFPEMIHGVTVRILAARAENSRNPIRRRDSLERIHHRDGKGHSRE